MKQPMQPMMRDARGTARFHGNAIVRWLLDEATAGRKTNLNDIATREFSQDDRQQFAQLIGYSLSGYHELPYVSDESARVASQAAHDQLGEEIGGCRDGGCPIHSGMGSETGGTSEGEKR